MRGSASRREGFAWKACLLALVAWIVGYVLLVHPATLQNQAAREHAMNVAFLGTVATQRAEDRALTWFKSMAIDNGLLKRSLSGAAGTAAETHDPTLGQIMRPAKTWMVDRVRVFWGMTLQVMVRLSVAMLWWGFLLVCLFPCVVDALVIRKIKASNFGLASPHRYIVGRHVVLLAPLSVVMLLLAPITLPSMVMPVLCVAFAGALWVAIANFAKRA